MSFRLVVNFIFISALFLVLLSFAMFQGGFTSWFLFFSFLPIFLYQIGLLFYPMKKWQVTREITPSFVEAGSWITVNVKIHRKIAFPLYYCVCEELFPESLNREDHRQEKYEYMESFHSMKRQRNKKQLIFPGFKRTFNITYQLSQLPRGEHELNRIRVRTSDVFGLIKKDHVFQTTDHLMVYPSKRLIHLDEQSQSHEHGTTSTQSLNLNNTNVASGVREYSPGDRFTWIDWKQTARKNTMMTKEFEQEKSTDTLIVLDSMVNDRFNELAFEATVEIAYSLIDMFKKDSTPSGLLTIGEKATFFPVQHYISQGDLIERHLTTIQPTGKQAFSQKVKEELLRLQTQSLIIIITTHIDDRLKETVKQLKMQKKRVILLFVQAEKTMTQTDFAILQHLTQQGIFVSRLTESELTKDYIEVNQL